MSFSEALEGVKKIFLDTAPIIYAIQISAALDAEADAFLTNDKKLSGIKEIRMILLSDYLPEKKP